MIDEEIKILVHSAQREGGRPSTLYLREEDIMKDFKLYSFDTAEEAQEWIDSLPEWE